MPQPDRSGWGFLLEAFRETRSQPSRSDENEVIASTKEDVMSMDELRTAARDKTYPGFKHLNVFGSRQCETINPVPGAYRRELDPERPVEKDLRDYFRVATEQRCLEDARMKRIVSLRLRSDLMKFPFPRSATEIESDLTGSLYTFKDEHDTGFRLDRRLPVVNDSLLKRKCDEAEQEEDPLYRDCEDQFRLENIKNTDIFKLLATQ